MGMTDNDASDPVIQHADLASRPLAGWDSTNWDLNTQQPHGGQEWQHLGDRFVEDFSVTTNFMGPPWKALSAATASLQHIDHYPAANFEPAFSDLSDFLVGQEGDAGRIKSRLLLGNGASELIDLVTRCAAEDGSFRVRSHVQYKEYERAAKADGRDIATEGDPCAILAIVNPCNPTGEYLTVEKLCKYIEDTVTSPCTVVVDESMQLWVGHDWRKDSLLAKFEWIQEMAKKNINIYLIHSWTKIWSCPGIRLGSVLCPTEAHAIEIKRHQVPWSLNICALAFLSEAVKQTQYLQETWSLTPKWRNRTEEFIKLTFPDWEVLGEPWLSWLWVDTKSEQVAKKIVELAKAAGCPIRHGAMGYNCPTFIRLAVRDPDSQDLLFKALKSYTA